MTDNKKPCNSTPAIRLGRGKSQESLNLISASHTILAEIQPATVRAVCYRLFILKLIPAMSRAATGKISKLLVGAREQGVIPWNWIVDETREAERISSWENPAEIIDAAVRGYRKDYWASQPEWVEVWSEKGTIRGTLAPVLKEYGVTFRVMHGYGSATSLHGIAEETANCNKPLTVLYVGDWDPSGLNMSEVDIPGRLGRYGGHARIIRVALDESDVTDDTKLPWFEAETKEKDPRFKWFSERYGKRCWELDALSPVILRQRVEANIRLLLDEYAWDRAIEVEAVERDSMSVILTAWKKSISRLDAKYSEGMQ